MLHYFQDGPRNERGGGNRAPICAGREQLGNGTADGRIGMKKGSEKIKTCNDKRGRGPPHKHRSVCQE
jgi:hypothetical protein